MGVDHGGGRMSSGTGEKTEKATPKRKKEQREKGNVLKSQDLSISLQLLGFFAFLSILAPTFGGGLERFFREYFSGRIQFGEQLDIAAAAGLGRGIVGQALLIMAPLFAFAVGAAILVNVLQTGFLVTGKTLAVKLERISPISGFKRLFSSRSIVEMLKSLLKIALVIYILYQGFASDLQDIPHLMAYGAANGFGLIARMIFSLALRCGAVFLVLAGFDYLYQWWKHGKDMRMTKQEIKEEYKMTEGNPQTKGRIRQIQRILANQRMMQDVPLADVVITNPTHFAIALRYDPDHDAAPIVLAKGKDYLAQRIKEIARDSRVLMVENRPLAQSLYKMTKVGGLIPADLYQAVAEVLAYVLKIKGGMRR